MTKIVVNKCYGGFELSDEAMTEYAKQKGINLHRKEDHGLMMYSKIPWDQVTNDMDYDDYWVYDKDIPRDEPELVKTVEKLGSKASGWTAQLEIVEVPDDVRWTIEEYDGIEWIAEVHRTW